MRLSRCGAMSSKAVRQLLLGALLTVVCGLQGCATSLETLGLGVGLGALGVAGGAVCMLACH